MKKFILNRKKIEIIILIIVWFVVFLIPIFNEVFSPVIQFHWKKIFAEWVRLLGYLIVFLINLYFLIPQFLFKKKYKQYFSFTVVVIAFAILLGMIFPKPNNERDGMENDLIRENLRERKPPRIFIIDDFIIYFLIVGAGTSVKLVGKWLDEEQRSEALEKEQLKTNLALLKNQVSPHFFMNTLNNIHSLVDIDAKNAKDAIIKLSTLMRYLLYESTNEKIELKKELDFIKSYIELMKIRYSDEVEIQMNVPNPVPNLKIPPLLFISFIENAFKYGISYPAKSYIYFNLSIIEKTLHCTIKNSKHADNQPQNDDYSGIGLNNIEQTLKLLYQNTYVLNINDAEKVFEINVEIPL